MNYKDFDLEIKSNGDSQYTVCVKQSPAGEAECVVTFPYNKAELENLLLKVQIALLQSSTKQRHVRLLEEESIERFGSILFDTFFRKNEPVLSCFDSSYLITSQRKLGLRIRLRCSDPELAALPWEFLFDSRHSTFVALSGQTPIVRYLEVQRPLPKVHVSGRVRILGLVASPRGLDQLDIAAEKQRIESGLDTLLQQGVAELVWVEGQTWRSLQDAMAQGPWHVFHFVGHGGSERGGESVIALADENGGIDLLPASALAYFLTDHHTLRLVVLNSCEGARQGPENTFSSTASVLVRHGVPAVIAMQYAITDTAAIEFASSFYKALANGVPIDGAVTEARKAVLGVYKRTFEWGTPVLFTRAAGESLFSAPTRRAKVKKASEATTTGDLPIVSPLLSQANVDQAPPPASTLPANDPGSLPYSVLAETPGMGLSAGALPSKPTPTPTTTPTPAQTQTPTKRKIMDVGRVLGLSFTIIALLLLLVGLFSLRSLLGTQFGGAETPNATPPTRTASSAPSLAMASTRTPTVAETPNIDGTALTPTGFAFTLPSPTLDATATAKAKATLLAPTAAPTDTPEPTLAPTPTPEPVEMPTVAPGVETQAGAAGAAAQALQGADAASDLNAAPVPNQPPDGAVFQYPLSPVFQWEQQELNANQHYLLEIIHGMGTDVHVLDETNWLPGNWMVNNQPKDGLFQWHVALCQGGNVGDYPSIGATGCERTGEFSSMLTFHWINPQPFSPLKPPLYATVVP